MKNNPRAILKSLIRVIHKWFMNQLHLKVQYTKYLRFDPKITILKQKYK